MPVAGISLYSRSGKSQALDMPYIVAQVIAKIHEIDPEAFIVTSNVTKVHGGKWGL